MKLERVIENDAPIEIDQTLFSRSSDTDDQMMILFEHVISNELIEWICELINTRVRSSNRGPQTKQFTPNEVKAILSLFIRMLTMRTVNITHFIMQYANPISYQYGDERVTINLRRWRLFVELFELDGTSIHQFFAKLNTGLQSVIAHNQSTNVSHTTVDESMIAWHCYGDRWLVYIPRKPNPFGIRVYCLALTFSKSNRPILLAMIPDVPTGASGFMAPKVRSVYSVDYNDVLLMG